LKYLTERKLLSGNVSVAVS